MPLRGQAAIDQTPQAQGEFSLGLFWLRTSQHGISRWPGSRLAIVAPLLLLAFFAGRLVAATEFQPTAQDTIVSPDAKLELLWDRGEFTEGPAADADGAILFSDIGNRILRFDPPTKQVSVYREPSGKANGLAFDRAGRLIACEGANGGARRLSITSPAGQVTALADRYEGKRFNSPNDVTVDRTGRVFFSDPRYVGDEPVELDFAGVFVVPPNGKVRLATRDVSMPNGLAPSPDGRTLYVADNSPQADGNHQLLAFTIQPDGQLSNKKVLFDFGPDFRGIDGMTVDAAGNIFATAGRDDAAGVYVFDPAGKALAMIPTPGAPTNCEFGRGAEARELYVTSALGREETPSNSHGLFRIRLR